MNFLAILTIFAPLVLTTEIRHHASLEEPSSSSAEYSVGDTMSKQLTRRRLRDENCAGFIKEDSDIGEVFAKFRVPMIIRGYERCTKDEVCAGEAWVGIDGFPCDGGASLRVGVTWTQTRIKETTYTAWSQWFPEARTEFDLAIQADDDIEFNVLASSNTDGVAKIINRSTGKFQGHAYNDQSTPLCRDRAEWMVSRVVQPSSEEKVGLADYVRITFKGAAYASGKTGELHYPVQPKVVQMQDNVLGFRKGIERSRCGFKRYSTDLVCISNRSHKRLGDMVPIY